MMVGTYSPFTTNISADEMNVFKKATSQLMGVNYQPLAVSTQVVSGTNYRFFCNATPVYPDAVASGVIMQIYQALDGTAHITEIHKV